MVFLSKKMEQFQTSIFTELSVYKAKKKKEGRSLIDLSIGSPDLPPPSFIVEELVSQVQDVSQYKYALDGITELHEAIHSYYIRHYDVEVHAQHEILSLMGSQDGLVHLPSVLANEGEVILVPNPGYTAYAAGISLAGAIPYSMPLSEENQFLPNLEAIPSDIREKAKLMIINVPGNPIPNMADTDYFEKLIHFAKKHDIFILHDFAYSELYYEKKPISLLAIEGAKEVAIEFNSLSKSFNMAGCRIGYVVGNATVIQALKRLKSNLDFGVFIPIQKAAARALNDRSSFSGNLRDVYRKRRNTLVSGLHSIGWHVDQPQASMFVWAKIPFDISSLELAYRFIDETGVVMIPGIAFGSEGEGYMRMAFVQDEVVLQTAVNQLKTSSFFNNR
ncbi:LL-diaminopimelate aminotransferase [Halalkalibacter sp. APA_J-10(15)]|uniref:LL-diaminopimelate aminotransferase n=1 Tax=Halalkalibacter sp. APA_J-10(15) TaxID=2933805 RepID=UPI001FF40355|nr:LL-diaminopimelate aminotransferase [Halalkalibacter sp. APA_J-10(15)]MCK0473084.1 LL-diaminopimelate aminotransferase [Halalkalibacter sp. APA_J-10(15)]